MTLPVPRLTAWRIRPVLVVNTALATALLLLAAGDVARFPEPVGAASSVPPDGSGDTEAAGSDDAVTDDGVGETQGASPHSLPPEDAARERLADEMSRLLADTQARLSVSVLAMDGGLSVGYGEGAFDTASIVKVDVLAALLLQAQDEGRELTGYERGLAEAAIQRSDNASTDELWTLIGTGDGLDAANERLGLTETTAGPDYTWGLTQTTSEDQIALLRAVFGDDSPLEPESRAYIQELMGSVVPDQQWGISAAADGDFELKNGWLPRSQTGLWDINSIGRVVVDDDAHFANGTYLAGDTYLVAVVSDGHVSQAAGIAVVEAAARLAVEAISAGPDV
ncbi:serine hydrolase [Streptomyces sp. B6B3]|uniref:serine hydrolase n=1 Tax=Streptomyces sp. B6B3 TaxID=3153570 RepID=UPI00325DA020